MQHILGAAGVDMVSLTLIMQHLISYNNINSYANLN